MISFTVRMKFRPDDRQRVHELLTALAHASRLEPGCVTYIPHAVEGEPDTIVVYEQYRDQQATAPWAASISSCSIARSKTSPLWPDRSALLRQLGGV
jgi:quinol monooxygenase YgiN